MILAKFFVDHMETGGAFEKSSADELSVVVSSDALIDTWSWFVWRHMHYYPGKPDANKNQVEWTLLDLSVLLFGVTRDDENEKRMRLWLLKLMGTLEAKSLVTRIGVADLEDGAGSCSPRRGEDHAG